MVKRNWTKIPNRASKIKKHDQEKTVNDVFEEKGMTVEEMQDADAEKKFEMFIHLRDRQVKRITLLSRTLGVSRPTIYNYIERYEKVLRQSAFDRSFDIEREQEYASISTIINEMRGEIKDLDGRSKIASLRDIASVMRQRGELYGIYEGGMTNLDNKKTSNVSSDEVSDIERLTENIKEILNRADTANEGGDNDDGGV